MRRSASWMTIWDDRILEYIWINGSGSPTKIANQEHVHVSKQHLSRRLSKLADNGLLDRLGNGVYQINHKGECYLSGFYDVEQAKYTNYSSNRADIDGSKKSRIVQTQAFHFSEDPFSQFKSECNRIAENIDHPTIMPVVIHPLNDHKEDSPLQMPQMPTFGENTS